MHSWHSLPTRRNLLAFPSHLVGLYIFSHLDKLTLLHARVLLHQRCLTIAHSFLVNTSCRFSTLAFPGSCSSHLSIPRTSFCLFLALRLLRNLGPRGPVLHIRATQNSGTSLLTPHSVSLSCGHNNIEPNKLKELLITMRFQ